MYGDRTVTVEFRNYTGSTLTLQDAQLEEGEGAWTENMYPPREVGAASGSGYSSVTFAARSTMMMTGCAGYARYVFPDNETTITLNFANPYVGQNSYNPDISGMNSRDYNSNYTGGKGEEASVIMSLLSA